jgi:hypothetical protein
VDAFNRFEGGERREFGFLVMKSRGFLGAVRARVGRDGRF